MKNKTLNQTIEEIEKMLIENDLAGCVLLFEDGQSVHFVSASPSWSCLEMLARNGNSAAFRFKAASEHYKDNDERIHAVATTACLLVTMIRRLKEQIQKVEMLKEVLANTCGMEATELFRAEDAEEESE